MDQGSSTSDESGGGFGRNVGGEDLEEGELEETGAL